MSPRVGEMSSRAADVQCDKAKIEREEMSEFQIELLYSV